MTSTGFNPTTGMPAGDPRIVAGVAVPLTAPASGLYQLPSGQTFSAVVVTNASPWLLEVSTLFGQHTLQPFIQDVCYPAGNTIPWTTVVPPGGSATGPAAPVYMQADCYVSGGGMPEGTFPMSLTATAIADILGTITTLTTPAGNIYDVGISTATAALFGPETATVVFSIFLVVDTTTAVVGGVVEVTSAGGTLLAVRCDVTGESSLSIPFPVGVAVPAAAGGVFSLLAATGWVGHALAGVSTT